MPSGFEARSGNDIHARISKSCRLVGGCRRTDGDDALCPTLVQDFSRRNSEDEAERRDVRVQ